MRNNSNQGTLDSRRSQLVRSTLPRSTRTDFSNCALYEVHRVAGQPAGLSDDLKRSADRLEESLDQPAFWLTVRAGALHDTNVLAPANTPVTLTGGNAPGSGALVPSLALSGQSSPSRRWGFGAAASSTMVNHTGTQQALLDRLTTNPTAWVSWWNLRTLEAKLAYDVQHVLLNRKDFTTFYVAYGPQLTTRWTPNRRSQFEFSYRYRLVTYPNLAGPANSGVNSPGGTQHTASLKWSIAAPGPRAQPYVGYAFDYNNANGSNFRATTNSVEGGVGFWFRPEARLTAGFVLHQLSFSDAASARTDRVWGLKADGAVPIGGRLTAQANLEYTNATSNQSSSFNYSRIVTSGP